MYYTARIQGDCCLFPVEYQYNCLMSFFVFSEDHRDEFILSKVTLFDLGSHYDIKGAAIIFEYGFTVAPPITSIYLTLCEMGNGQRDKQIPPS